MLMLVPSVIFTSCKDDETTADPAFDILKDYLVAEGMDLDHIIKDADGAKFVVAAPATIDEVPAFIAKYYIMDIRSADAFTAFLE